MKFARINYFTFLFRVSAMVSIEIQIINKNKQTNYLSCQIFCHNFIISIISYTIIKSTITNISYIIFNLSGLLNITFSLMYLLLPFNLALLNCRILGYTHGIIYLIYKSSLVIFLLNRIISISQKNYDYWISFSLFLVRTGFQVSIFFFIIKLLINDRNLNCLYF